MSELTRRRVAQTDVEVTVSAPSRIVKTLKKLDVYQKTEKDFVEQTDLGGFVSLAAFVLMAALAFYEIRSYWAEDPVDQLSVDLTRDEHLKINLDINFHSLPCTDVNIDVMDVMGDPILRVQQHLYKHRLHENGEPLEAVLESISADERERKLTRFKTADPAAACGDCHIPDKDDLVVGSNAPKRCCNTCNDVKEAFKEIGWEDKMAEDTEQCQRERELESRIKNDEKEGCRLEGYLQVNKIAGNFHFAPGRTFVSQHGHHIHEFKPEQAAHFNVSHTVNSLTFGDEQIPGVENILKGSTRISAEGPGVFQYFIKIVPTSYVSDTLVIADTYQYACTEHKKESGSGSFILPGVFFMYDLNPIRVTISQTRAPLGQFLTRLCAVVGGIFTVSGLTDAVIGRLVYGKKQRSRVGPSFGGGL